MRKLSPGLVIDLTESEAAQKKEKKAVLEDPSIPPRETVSDTAAYEECSICLDDLQRRGGVAVLNPGCGHDLHLSCVLLWCARQGPRAACPLCLKVFSFDLANKGKEPAAPTATVPATPPPHSRNHLVGVASGSQTALLPTVGTSSSAATVSVTPPRPPTIPAVFSPFRMPTPYVEPVNKDGFFNAEYWDLSMEHLATVQESIAAVYAMFNWQVRDPSFLGRQEYFRIGYMRRRASFIVINVFNERIKLSINTGGNMLVTPKIPVAMGADNSYVPVPFKERLSALTKWIHEVLDRDRETTGNPALVGTPYRRRKASGTPVRKAKKRAQFPCFDDLF